MRLALFFLFSPISVLLICLSRFDTNHPFLYSAIRLDSAEPLEFPSFLSVSPSTVISLHLWPYFPVATGNSAHLFNLFTSCIPARVFFTPSQFHRSSLRAASLQRSFYLLYLFSYVTSRARLSRRVLLFYKSVVILLPRYREYTANLCNLRFSRLATLISSRSALVTSRRLLSDFLPRHRRCRSIYCALLACQLVASSFILAVIYLISTGCSFDFAHHAGPFASISTREISRLFYLCNPRTYLSVCVKLPEFPPRICFVSGVRCLFSAECIALNFACHNRLTLSVRFHFVVSRAIRYHLSPII